MRHGMTGYNMTQTHGITVQYNAIHHNMAQHILLKPVIPSPTQSSNTRISSGYTKQNSRTSFKTALVFPSHHPVIPGDETKTEISKTLMSPGTLRIQQLENSPRLRRV